MKINSSIAYTIKELCTDFAQQFNWLFSKCYQFFFPIHYTKDCQWGLRTQGSERAALSKMRVTQQTFEMSAKSLKKTYSSYTE